MPLLVIVCWLAIVGNFFVFLRQDKLVKTNGKQMGYFYQVDLARREAIDSATFELAAYLNSVFKRTDGRIVYDIRNVNPYKMWNSDQATVYYLTNEPIDPDNNYSTELFAINISLAKQSLLPYLYSNEYCQSDGDCLARDESCAYGGFNNFSDYMPVYNCGKPVDKDGIKGDGVPYYYGIADPKLGCVRAKVWVEYNGASCNKNVCRGANRKIICR